MREASGGGLRVWDAGMGTVGGPKNRNDLEGRWVVQVEDKRGVGGQGEWVK